jgi:hypothetical protein
MKGSAAWRVVVNAERPDGVKGCHRIGSDLLSAQSLFGGKADQEI